MFGSNGIYWNYVERNLEWMEKPRIAKIWTNSVDIDNIGLTRKG